MKKIESEPRKTLGGLSKTGRRIAREVLNNENVTREQLEQMANRVVCNYETPMDAINSIAETAGLVRSQCLELRRIVIAMLRQDKFSIGDTVMSHSSGDEVMIVKMGAGIPKGRALVETGNGKEEVYLTDLEAR